jgi:hypothetical protein
VIGCDEGGGKERKRAPKHLYWLTTVVQAGTSLRGCFTYSSNGLHTEHERVLRQISRI